MLCVVRTGTVVGLAYTAQDMSVGYACQKALKDTHHDGTVLCTRPVEITALRVTVVLEDAGAAQCFGVLET